MGGQLVRSPKPTEEIAHAATSTHMKGCCGGGAGLGQIDSASAERADASGEPPRKRGGLADAARTPARRREAPCVPVTATTKQIRNMFSDYCQPRNMQPAELTRVRKTDRYGAVGVTRHSHMTTIPANAVLVVGEKLPPGTLDLRR